ncbi:hypothetical protein A9Q91_05735 [Candidatus Gracilibacteria bacterium 28_42_T64]|nr:hypothetical protein A9Q91_05735 [Candidatus Gracilibacteria bacterium 28_42_T64]
MIKNRIIKLKKYLFLISVIFFVTTFSHLLYTYLYNDSELIPLKGGTISEGLIGDFPSLNPLKPLTGNNKYIIQLLYRSLLRYDIKENKITSDIASCDISDLKNIECYLEENVKWSNGNEISNQDIIATYQLLKNTNINPIISSLLSETTIEEKDNIIRFTNKKKDINFLNIFFQPILPKELLDTLPEESINGNFSTIDQIYSGKFKIVNVSRDFTLGITKFILEKNLFYNKNDILINQFIIKLFPDTNSFLKNKDTVNIFNDKNNLIGTSIPRFEAFGYTLPQYVSTFLNTDTIKNKTFRSYILNSIDKNELLDLLGKENFKEVKNPYLTEIEIFQTKENLNITKTINSLGYYKKATLIKNIIPSKDAKTYSEESSIIPSNSGSIEHFQEPSETITSPNYVEKYNFISKDNILLKGRTTDGVTAVYINDYKLTGYNAGDTVFYYKLLESYNTITEGRNKYNIYFETKNEKKFIEEINFLYYKDQQKTEIEKQNFIQDLYLQEKETEITKKINIESEKPPINSELLDKLSKLNDNYYYNNKYKKLSLKLFYVATDKNLEITANYIKKTLEENGIGIELIPVSLSQLIQTVSNKDAYDIILAGVHLGHFNYNIFPYFHSSQVKSGYNFTSIRKTSLDILLEELKGDINSVGQIEKIEKKVLDIISNEQVISTLYTPKINLLIDKNIKNIHLPTYLPHKSLRSSFLNTAYKKEKKIVKFENKSTINFFKFLLEKINE